MSDITILHLSDIHFRKKKDEQNKTFRQNVQEELIKAVKTHAQEKGNPDFVAITGDIAFSGQENEYEDALEFFTGLRALLPPGTRFLVVPGNHDVDRQKVKKLKSMHQIVNENGIDDFLEDKDYTRSFINSKFEAYRKFSQQLNPALYEAKEDYYWVKDFHDKQVSFLGLNSCWACENDDDRNNITLGYPQVREAFEKSTQDNRVLLMHHPPFNWLNETDFSRYNADIFNRCGLILHGHTHLDNALVLKNLVGSCICLGANASYTNEKTGFIGFQFIRMVFLKEGTAASVWPYRLETRNQVRFVPDTHRWEGQDGPCFDLGMVEVLQKKETKKEKIKSLLPLEIPVVYKNWIREFHSILPLDHLARKGEAITLNLPEVYISLETANPFHKAKDEMHGPGGKESLLRAAREDSEATSSKEPSTIEIEKLLERWHCLLVRGNAGMGKTTLIKHLAYSLTHGSGPVKLRGCLPVLVFLKDFWPLYRDRLKKEPPVNITFASLLEIYLEKSRCPLSMDIVENFLQHNRLLLLLDGLDEVPGSIRSDLVNLMHRFQFEHKGNRFLITGRPHGIEGECIQRFAKYLRDIEPLDSNKSSEFISKWLRAISGQATGFAEVNAADLIADIREQEHAAVFTGNPLLLTGLCILYLVGGKRIPDQRADLYDRITANLLYRRFHDPADQENENKVREYLMLLAFTMQNRHAKSIEAIDAKELLKEKFHLNPDETAHQYKKRIDRRFKGIEPECGLLNRLSSGEIEFSHLSFQEFLAGKHMLDRDIKYKKYLEDPWWEETLLLHIGLMNLEMKARSNGIVREILEGYPGVRFQLLGCKALRDFQSSKREEEVVTLARKKLNNIIQSGASLEERFEAGDLLGTLGDPRIKSSPMVHIKAGEFTRGGNEREREQPVRRIYLDEFFIGKYPVTNEEFQAFIHDNGYSNRDVWSPEGWKWKEEEKISLPDYWHDRKWNQSNFPVVGVSWYEAEAFANWLSREIGETYRLPTEAQWEKAARGADGNEYPWGNEFDKNKCNSDECGLGRTSPVGIFPAGASPYGCLDMAGNVWEWCSDWFEEDYYKKSPEKNPVGPTNGSDRVLRGGCWIFGAAGCRTAYRIGVHPGVRGDVAGFRLVRSF